MLKDTSQDPSAVIEGNLCDGCGQSSSHADLRVVGDGALRVCPSCYERARLTFTP